MRTNLTSKDVHRIRSLCASGMTLTQIAARFHVTHQAVSQIVHCRIWKSVPGTDIGPLQRTGERHHSARLTADQVREIRKLRAKGMYATTLAARFGVTYAESTRPFCLSLVDNFRVSGERGSAKALRHRLSLFLKKCFVCPTG